MNTVDLVGHFSKLSYNVTQATAEQETSNTVCQCLLEDLVI